MLYIQCICCRSTAHAVYMYALYIVHLVVQCICSVLTGCRIQLPYGGDDVTRLFIQLLQRNAFPYKIDLRRIHDWQLADTLKVRYCTSFVGSATVQLLDFVHTSSTGTHRYRFKAYDEPVLATMVNYACVLSTRSCIFRPTFFPPSSTPYILHNVCRSHVTSLTETLTKTPHMHSSQRPRPRLRTPPVQTRDTLTLCLLMMQLYRASCVPVNMRLQTTVSRRCVQAFFSLVADTLFPGLFMFSRTVFGPASQQRHRSASSHRHVTPTRRCLHGKARVSSASSRLHVTFGSSSATGTSSVCAVSNTARWGTFGTDSAMASSWSRAIHCRSRDCE